MRTIRTDSARCGSGFTSPILASGDKNSGGHCVFGLVLPDLGLKGSRLLPLGLTGMLRSRLRHKPLDSKPGITKVFLAFPIIPAALIIILAKGKTRNMSAQFHGPPLTPEE